MTQKTETNKKYKELKKSIENEDYYVNEKGDFVAVINDGIYDIGVINHRENVEVIVDTEFSNIPPRILEIAKDAGIHCIYANNLHNRIIYSRIKNLQDEVTSLQEKLSRKKIV